MSQLHLLRQPYLPDRYETLFERLGVELVKILVPPDVAILDTLERAAFAMQTRGESGVAKLLSSRI